MNWRQIKAANRRRSLRQYVGYLLSCSVAITIAFLFTCFVQNPHVMAGYMPKSARVILNLCDVIVIVFALFFVLFFHSALLRNRGKEFGLLLVLGVTPRQLGSMVFGESLWLGGISLLVGGALGLLFLKLFLLLVALILSVPTIPFDVPLRAVLETLILFGAIFLIDALMASVRVSRRLPRSILLSARARQTPPKASRVLAGLGILCLVCAYLLGLKASGAVMMTMIPILCLISIGTYLLFSQISVALFTRLRVSPRSGITRLVVARMAYRIKDNARVLTVVTLLSAMVMAGMGALTGLELMIQQTAVQADPFGLEWTVPQGTSVTRGEAKVTSILKAHHLSITDMFTTPYVVGTVRPVGAGEQRTETTVRVISLRSYDHLIQAVTAAHPEMGDANAMTATLASHHAFVVVPRQYGVGTLFPKHQAILKVGSSEIPVSVDRQESLNIMNQSTVGEDTLLVVPDNALHVLQTLAPSSARGATTGIMMSNWKMSKPVIPLVTQVLPRPVQSSVTDTITVSLSVSQLFSITLFAGLFVSVLFLLACATTLYFRLTTQREEDIKQFRALWRIGMDRGMSAKVLSTEIAILFFAPLLLALVHSTVAVQGLSNLMFKSFPPGSMAPKMWAAFAVIAAIYLLCLMGYYVIARKQYGRQVIAD